MPINILQGIFMFRKEIISGININFFRNWGALYVQKHEKTSKL